MNKAIFWLTGPTNQSRPITNLFNFYVFCPIWMKFGKWTTFWLKTTQDEFEINTTISLLTTTTQTTSQATGGGGVRGSCGRGSEGPHHHQQDFTIFSLRREPPLLVYGIYFMRGNRYGYSMGTKPLLSHCRKKVSMMMKAAGLVWVVGRCSGKEWAKGYWSANFYQVWSTNRCFLWTFFNLILLFRNLKITGSEYRTSIYTL